ncbi:MAG: CPBP family intramembrane metalloprotease [Bdellovibrionales bacterium]|nr:CPBP family intramembrane metalloprotease [Bdellovibrionales bacterium]
MTKVSLKAQLITFLLITFLISWIEVYFIAKAEAGIKDNARVFALMWTPGLVGLVLSWVFGWRFKDIGFKLGKWRYYLWAYLVPAVTAVLILIALITTGLGEFQLSPKLLEKAGSTPKALMLVLLVSPVLGALIGSVSAFGEEIGWRGFLHSKMIALNLPHPFLLTGFIWAVWHWPLILFSNYATSDQPALSVALFTVTVTSFGVFIGWLREKSGTVFPAALTHGVHNLWIQMIYPTFLKPGALDPYFGGESGVIIAVIYGVLALVIYKKYLAKGRLKPLQI